jgi:[acyl-carrier-protein] S-malonyltransferase
MNDAVFLYPGQGAQAVGMGKDLFEKTDIGKEVFSRADEVLDYRFSRVCFEGPEEELKLTHNTQPALLTVSYILFQLLGQEPVLAAGHSLGEYSAVVCAGGLSFDDAVSLVHKRGKYMQEAVPVGRGAMAAIIGADIQRVKDVCDSIDGVVDLANWNSASQIVISGEKFAVEAAVEKISAPKSVFLPVSAPFHSRLMLPAEEKLAVDLNMTRFEDLRFPVVNNIEAREVTGADETREGLIKQVSRPVLWHSTLLKLLDERQARKFVELGTGKVLTGLLKRTAREKDVDVEIRNIQSFEDLRELKGFT